MTPAFRAVMEAQRAVEAEPLFAVAPLRTVESHPACPSCGLCCAVPAYRPISAGELWDLVDHLGCDLETFRRDSLRPDLPQSLKSPCAFLKREGERLICGVYAVRPSVCRRFSQCGVLQEAPEAQAHLAGAKARFAAWLDRVP